MEGIIFAGPGWLFLSFKSARGPVVIRVLNNEG